MKKIKELLSNPWLQDRRVLFGLWMILGIVSALAKLKHHNNYDIFRYVFYNTWNGQGLYLPSTDGGFWDLNHYGPFFSVIIAPFAVCPTWLGLLLWDMCLAAFLYWAVSLLCRSLPRLQVFIVWFCAHELLTALFMQQFNIAIAAIIILSYYFVEKERDEYATFFIIIGILVKLYGVVGLAFFFFSKHKLKYALSFFLWGALLFCLPMLISSPEYQFKEYVEWFVCLTEKNADNTLGGGTNISVMGMIHKIGYSLSVGRDAFMAVRHGEATVDVANWWYSGFNDLWVILPSMLLMAIGYFRVPQWKNEMFRQQILAAVLMFVVLFSTGSESSGYITPLIGCCIWYSCVPWQRTQWDVALLVFAFILTSLSPSDLFPRSIREGWVQPYALKALPVTLIWIKLAYEIITKKYDTAKL